MFSFLLASKKFIKEQIMTMDSGWKIQAIIHCPEKRIPRRRPDIFFVSLQNQPGQQHCDIGMHCPATGFNPYSCRVSFP
jgi:hypothetical protein